MQIGNSRKKCLFLPVIASAAVQTAARRIGLLLGTMVTAGFPFVAARKIKIGTVAGKSPAVMKRPDDFFTTGPQIIEQQTNMNIIAMNTNAAINFICLVFF